MNVARTAERQEQPGMSRIHVGMLLFLLSETFLFGNLFWTYFYLRAKSPVWPPQGVILDLPLIAVNTIILLSSSITMQLAINNARRGSLRGMARALIVTMFLGAIFLTIKGWEWTHGDFRPWDHAYGSIFYTLTGFHGLHVLVGIGMLLVIMLRTLRMPKIAPLYIEAGGLYWHFVDLIWIFVFTSLYIIR
ncbi:MAG: cytochrome c oxidase subunit 3 [Dehalococcoidia bacterium]|nr:cytochrome c oxidase subunit 3 [Dehalococcoidia bacterium]